jgi:hypothetical protein
MLSGMTYDLSFRRLAPGQSWAEAVRAAGEPGADGVDIEPPDEAVWSAIVTEVRRLVGDVSLFVRGAVRALDHVPTGIELSYAADRASVSVPYWYSGDEASAILHKMYALGEVIERHTGLRGYDLQAELPLAEARRHIERGVSAFDQVAVALGRARRDPHR